MTKRETSMKHKYGIILGLFALFSGTSAAQADGVMHPLGAEKAKVITATEQKTDKEHGVISFNPYHILQPENAEKSVPVYAVSAGKIYDIEETKDEGLKVFLLHDDSSRSSYSLLSETEMPKYTAHINKGDIIGYTDPKFENKLKYELVANNGYVIRHGLSMNGNRNNQNFVYTAEDVGFAFYNANPLGASPSSNSTAGSNNSGPLSSGDAGTSASNYYVAQQFAATSSGQMSSQQIEDTLCPWQVQRALDAQAEIKLENIERMRSLVMTEPASVKMLACHDSFVKDMATNVATKGIFGKIINIFGADGNSNRNFGTRCEGTGMVWGMVKDTYGLDKPRNGNGSQNAHRNIMYPGRGPNSYNSPVNYPQVLAPLYAPNLSTHMAAFFQPGSRARNLNVDGNGNPIGQPFYYPINPNWGVGQAATTIETVISGQRVNIPRTAYYP